MKGSLCEYSLYPCDQRKLQDDVSKSIFTNLKYNGELKALMDCQR